MKFTFPWQAATLAVEDEPDPTPAELRKRAVRLRLQAAAWRSSAAKDDAAADRLEIEAEAMERRQSQLPKPNGTAQP